MPRFRRSRIALIATVVATTAVTAACSKRTASTGSHSSGSSGRKLSVIVVSGPLSDPFFGAMKTGADNAGKELNVSTEYLSPTSTDASGPTLARLMQAAVAKKPDAIVVGNFFPAAQNPEIKAAVKAGIPVVVINSGESDWKQDGALAFVGIEPAVAGTRSGEKSAKLGVKKGLCVNTVPGNPALEQLCQGYTDALKKGGGTGSELRIPYQDATNPTKVTQAIEGALKADKSIDGVMATGSIVAESALSAANDVGRKLVIGSGDPSTKVLKDIEAGKIQYAMDQQPYLQTYYGVLIAKQYVQYKISPSGTVLTGPLVIDKDSAAAVLKINETYQGIRGAA
ncbi:sugar ABC transporter substrate-binding protein [Streptomyces sp. NPDC001507]|uniref:sugar ABC transporter substrate-binding protein n=1 Tax=Streptomyces sp. NPDC001507 TaxID=3364579 RepID=UPI003680EFAB